MESTVARHFLGWDQPALPAAANLLVEHYADGSQADLSGALVVVPGARPGRRLKELLLDESERRDIRLVPPRIISVGSLPEALYDAAHSTVDSITARRLWAVALRGLDAAERNVAFPHAPEDGDMRGWEILGGDVQRLQRDVAGGGHRFSDVADRCRDDSSLLFRDHDRWEVLANAQGRYEELLAGIGRSDPDLARIAALKTGGLSTSVEVWLLGVAEMPFVLRQMLRNASGRIHALVHAPADEAAAFDDLGCVLPEAWAEREIRLPEDVLRIAQAPGDQSDFVLAALADLGEQTAPDDVAVAVPDTAIVPFLERRLDAHKIPNHYAAGLPLPRTAPYQLLAAFGLYVRLETWESFAALVRHPDVGAWLSKRVSKRGKGILTEVDQYFCQHLPARVPRRPPPGSPVASVIANIESLAAPLREKHRLSEWPQHILGVLAAVLGERDLTRGTPAQRRLIDTLEAIRGAAIVLTRLPDAANARCSGAEAIDVLLEAVRGASIPAEPDEAAVEILGWLEMPLDDAPAAIVTGFNEPHLPESTGADLFLPDRLRKQLGLLDNATRYARDAYILTALIESRRFVRVIAGRTTAAGDPLTPSRLMLAARGAELATRVLRFAETAGPSLVLPVTREHGESSRFALPPMNEIMLPQIDRIAVSAFGAFLKHPYVYALQNVLRLNELTDTAREMDGGVFGSLAHEVLAAFGRSDTRDSADATAIRRHLNEFLDDHAWRAFGRDEVLPSVPVQIELLRMRLGEFARWQAERAASGWRIVVVEGDVIGGPADVGRATGDTVTEAPFEVDGQPITLRGRIDRIDHHSASGRFAICDYKTGDRGEDPDKVHRSGPKNDKRWVDLQLPLYRHLAAGVRRRDGHPLLSDLDTDLLDLGYILLPCKLAGVEFAKASWTVEELREADDVARGVVREIRRGGAVFDDGVTRHLFSDRLKAFCGSRVLTLDDETDEVEA
ncbi:PD-(D/E)XK nuclease family protein [soil metagenome]